MDDAISNSSVFTRQLPRGSNQRVLLCEWHFHLPPDFSTEHVAFGYSAITEHWLSRKPCNIADEIWSARATGKARDAWAAQAKADWHAFLQYRALEMQPSSQLLIVGSGANQNGDSGAEGLMDLANAVLQQLVKDGARFEKESNARAFAETYAGFFKAAYEPCLFVRLSDKRTPG